MSKFTEEDEPTGRFLPHPRGHLFQLLTELVFHVGSEQSPSVVRVPVGTLTDFASIPRTVQLFIPKDIGRRAAIIHDYLYQTRGLGGKYTRKQCDEIFLDALSVLNVDWPTRKTLYAGVRIGGWVAWRNHKKTTINTPPK